MWGSRGSVESSISEIRKAYVDDVGIGVIVNVISEIGKAYVDDVGIGVIDGLDISNRICLDSDKADSPPYTPSRPQLVTIRFA